MSEVMYLHVIYYFSPPEAFTEGHFCLCTCSVCIHDCHLDAAAVIANETMYFYGQCRPTDGTLSRVLSLIGKLAVCLR